MEVGTIIALVVAVPLVLFPAALVWYINIGGILRAVKEARQRRPVEGRATVKA